VPGAAEAIAAAGRAGIRVAYVTNNASRPPEEVAAHLQRLGIPAVTDDVVTSAQIAASLLARRLGPGARVLVVGGAGLRQALDEEGLVAVETLDGDPEAVVQGFGPEVGWRHLAEGARAVRAGLPWMATNLDRTVPTENGPAPGNGALVRAVATAAGRDPDEVAGKPGPAAFTEAARRYGSTRPLVVGDRLDTDLEGARAAGIPGLAVLTGVTGVAELLAASVRERPDFLGTDLSALHEPHPAARRGPDGRASCRAARVRVAGPVPEILAPGDDPVDLLRAAAVAAWAWRDSGSGRGVDPAPVEAAVRALTPVAGPAR
jgi:HAD superfamily hydrolase (TIGR01450 family)